MAASNLEQAQGIVGRVQPSLPLYRHALASAHALLAETLEDKVAAAAGFAEAARGWHDFGVPYEEGQALLGRARCLVALGSADEAAGPLGGTRDLQATRGKAGARGD